MKKFVIKMLMLWRVSMLNKRQTIRMALRKRECVRGALVGRTIENNALNTSIRKLGINMRIISVKL